ncbi:hypothetical protein P4S63_02170 [Pseudoalteromonas sp. B193]
MPGSAQWAIPGNLASHFCHQASRQAFCLQHVLQKHKITVKIIKNMFATRHSSKSALKGAAVANRFGYQYAEPIDLLLMFRMLYW